MLSKMNNKPIFLLGSERSGTNLLRTRLDNHSNIAGPVPIHTMAWFYDKEIYYGDLHEDDNWKVLVDDMIRSVEINIHQWDIKFDYKTIDKNIPEADRSVVKLFSYIYDKYAAKKNKNKWFCKDNHLVDYAWVLNYYFPDGKFIYLVRDPRDVCLSHLRKAGGLSTAYTFSLTWKKEQQKCIRVLMDDAFKDKILLVKYEEILLQPEKAFKRICNFLNEKYEPDMLKGGEREEAKASRAWKNVSKDIMQNNMKKYLDGLSSNQIKIVEKITCREMNFLDYELEYKQNKYHTHQLKRVYYEILEEFKKALTIHAQWEYDVRKKRNELKDKIKKRGLETIY